MKPRPVPGKPFQHSAPIPSWCERISRVEQPDDSSYNTQHLLSEYGSQIDEYILERQEVRDTITAFRVQQELEIDVPESQRMTIVEEMLDAMADKTELEREGYALGKFDITGYDEDSWPIDS